MARNDLAAEIGRQLLVGLGRIGGRAVAAGVKSVVRDGRKMASVVDERLKVASERLDQIVGDESASKRGSERPNDGRGRD